MCAPLNFSNIPGAPNKGYDLELFELVGLFHGNHKSSLSHIISFIKVMNESHIIHEDVWMHTFMCTLEDKAYDWFYDDLVGPITSLAYFLRSFLKYWEPSLESEEMEMFISCTIEPSQRKKRYPLHLPWMIKYLMNMLRKSHFMKNMTLLKTTWMKKKINYFMNPSRKT
jgi:hypothetical protein